MCQCVKIFLWNQLHAVISTDTFEMVLVFCSTTEANITFITFDLIENSAKAPVTVITSVCDWCSASAACFKFSPLTVFIWKGSHGRVIHWERLKVSANLGITNIADRVICNNIVSTIGLWETASSFVPFLLVFPGRLHCGSHSSPLMQDSQQ